MKSALERASYLANMRGFPPRIEAEVRDELLDHEADARAEERAKLADAIDAAADRLHAMGYRDPVAVLRDTANAARSGAHTDLHAEERERLADALEAFADWIASWTSPSDVMARRLRDAAQRVRSGEQVDVRAVLEGR